MSEFACPGPVAPRPWRQRAAVAALIVLAPLPARAQVPDNFTLAQPGAPVASPTPRPAPTAVRTPTAPPTVLPTATATPRPRPTPSATPSATPRLPPAPSPSPTPTASASPSPTPSATPAPIASATDVAPTPIVQPSPAPIAADAAAPAAGDDRLWLGMAIGGLGMLALLLGGWWWWRRRNGEDRGAGHWERPIAIDPAPPIPRAPPVEPVPEPVPPPTPPVPAAPPPPAPVPPAPVAAPPTPARPVPGGLVTTSLRPEINFAIRPVRAAIDTLRVTLDYELSIANVGRAPAHQVAIEAWLFSAGNDPKPDIETLLNSPVTRVLLAPFELVPGAIADLNGQTVMPREGMAMLHAGERRMFVPLLLIRAVYRDARGQTGMAADAFLVGAERGGQERLAPFELDRARGYDQLGVRRYEG